ncbi:SDR family oxidoreductase [Fulvivirga sp. RKSG066]|uniref:SDR family oxidoreductase n=1 Tax=Fulvivirga aurantia TaxID=2529383 RepID=UPI0012BBB240|nr:SDR family oxidoreductase [Fulvivirga aurantia]MTI22651.1 SDR family oxidoreductase [Fulvivirga aurantia]
MSQTVLITGSSSGFGKLISKTLLNKGYQVIATMRDPKNRNKDSAEELTKLGGDKVQIIDLDVTSDKSVENGVAEALKHHDKIDVLINNAGIGSGGISEGFTSDQLTKIMDVNVMGVHRLTRALLPNFRKHNNGLIINISSVMGRIVIPFASAYTASKFAVEGYTESLRYELKDLGIELVSVEPGGFMTGFFDNMQSPADEARVKEYGKKADVPDQMWSSMGDQLTGENAPNPQDVADAVLKLIKQPVGERPLRVVVDSMTGGEAPKAINKTTNEIQKELLEAFGLA